MQISTLVKEKILGNNIFIAALMTAFNRGQKTIENWVNENNDLLTTPKAVDIIKKHTGLTEAEIFTSETIAA